MVRWGRLHKAAAVRGETGHRFPAGDGRTGLALREPHSETEFGRGVWSPRPSGVHVGTGLRPRPLSPGGDGGCRRIRRGRPMCRPEYVLLREPFTGGYTGPPLRGVEGIPNHPGQRRTAERLRRGCEGMGGDRSRDHPKGTINAGQSRSQPAADSSLYTREPLGTGDADCRVASLLAMTVLILCHSEEAQRADVGIRSFLRWTGFGPPSRRPLRMVYRSPSNGPPYLGHGLRRPNFVPKFGASVKSSAPTGGCRKPPATAGAALSEAESAERAAGQIRFLPDDLRVQHGAQCSEASAKPRTCSRRGCDN